MPFPTSAPSSFSPSLPPLLTLSVPRATSGKPLLSSPRPASPSALFWPSLLSKVHGKSKDVIPRINRDWISPQTNPVLYPIFMDKQATITVINYSFEARRDSCWMPPTPSLPSLTTMWPCQVALASGKEPACRRRRPKKHGLGSIPDSERSPGGGHGNTLQYSYLENPIDRGAWWATVYRVARVRQNWSYLARTRTTCRLVASRSGSFSQVQDLKPHPNPCWTKFYIFTRLSADSMHTEIRGALVYLEIPPYFTWGNQDPRELNDLGRVTNLVKSELILLKEICFSPDPCSLQLYANSIAAAATLIIEGFLGSERMLITLHGVPHLILYHILRVQ